MAPVRTITLELTLDEWRHVLYVVQITAENDRQRAVQNAQPAYHQWADRGERIAARLNTLITDPEN